MSLETKLFQPPSHYPEAPKDMWYQVPEKPVEPSKPKPIFPWEGRAPKPTRVFPEQKAPTPPPEPEPEPAPAALTAASEVRPSLDESATPEPIKSPDPWAGFQSRSNAWDDVPEIERYMQSFQRPRQAKIQVLHQSDAQATTLERRPSMRLTDFPTEDDRPSLPVTPAPIRRPSFWGAERDQQGNLPAAEGVPQQEEWVRRFSSYAVPEFPASPPLLTTVNGVLIARCQYCGKQNPIAKLEELQRRQSEVLMSPENLQQAADLPSRSMPGSSSREAVEDATNKAISPEKSPKKAPLKPILKHPTFEVPAKEETAQTNAPETATSKRAAPTSTGLDQNIDTVSTAPRFADQVEVTGAADNPIATTMTTVKT